MIPAREIKWFPIVKTKASLLFQWLVFEGHKKQYYQSSLNLDFGLKNQKIISDEISIDLNEFIQLETLLTTKIKQNSNYLKDFIKLCYLNANNLIKTSEEIKINKDIFNLSNDLLQSLYRNYQNSVLNFMPFLNTILVIDGILKKELVQYLESDLKIVGKKEQDLLLSKLIVPKKKSFFVQETEMLFNIALKLQNNEDIDKDINDFLNKFSWMSSVAYLGKFQTKGDVLRKVQDLLKEDLKEKLVLIQEVKKETNKKYQEALQKINKSGALIDLIKLSQEFLYLQTYRLDIFSLAHYNAYSLYEEIGKRFGYGTEELVYLTGDEILKLFGREQVNKKEIGDRQKNYALVLKNDQFTLFSGNNVNKTYQQQVDEIEIKGMVANRGRAKGKAKLIFEIEDIEKVEKGDIIVSPMTRPELMPALVKAGGIITDFGGILCHAAIVSREFGIPCIVGTEKATKVFSDGNLIELNAYEGTARKIRE